MSFPRYPAYKDSGVAWLGEVPEHWGIRRLKQVVSPDRQITYGIVQAGPHVEDGVPYIRPADMSDESGIVDPPTIHRTSPEIAEAYRRSTIREGDLVCSIGPSFGKVMTTPGWLNGANLTQGTARVAVVETTSPRFVFWSLRSMPSVAQWESSVGGATFRALNLGPLAETWLLAPPLPEQHAIATFLDRETAKIDALVSEQQRLIELLKEKRQAVISHVVTKGLNPDAPMKDSGVEWIGEVPEHWEVFPLKRRWSVTDCKHVTAEFVEDGIPLASIREVQDVWVDLSDAKRTTEHFYELLIEGNREPRPGDLVFSRNATVGEVAQVRAGTERFAMGQDVVLLRKLTSTESSDFFQNVLRSPVVAQQLAVLMVGSTFKRINVEEIRGLIIPFPPPTEQREIASTIISIAESFDTLTTEATRAIALLQERRAALISAAVTGQIDVREVTA